RDLQLCRRAQPLALPRA
ncbi:hypothetical protein Tco_0574265, partial [Tanacetum coccineum]